MGTPVTEDGKGWGETSPQPFFTKGGFLGTGMVGRACRKPVSGGLGFVFSGFPIGDPFQDFTQG